LSLQSYFSSILNNFLSPHQTSRLSSLCPFVLEV
jgi:hypothetical protein